jgi:hypothetical protein
MFRRHPDKFPLIDVKTSSGWRVTIGPSAVHLILSIIYIALGAAMFLLGHSP